MPDRYEILNFQVTWDALDGTPMVANRGEVRDDLRPESIPWLLRDGHIKALPPEPAPKKAKKPELPASEEVIR